MSGMATREERAFWNEAIAILQSIENRIAQIEEVATKVDFDRQVRAKEEYHAEMQRLQEERDKLL